MAELQDNISAWLKETNCEHTEILTKILCGKTGQSSAGFPIISEESFSEFITNIPHLLEEGTKLLSQMNHLQSKLKDIPSSDKIQSALSATKVIGTVIRTAGVCSPTDLWIIRQIVSIFKHHSIDKELLKQKKINPESYGIEHKLSSKQLSLDLNMLYVRGYLDRDQKNYQLNAYGKELFEALSVLDDFYFGNWASKLGNNISDDDIKKFLHLDTAPIKKHNWIAPSHIVERCFRLVPLVLYFRTLNLTDQLVTGVDFENKNPTKLQDTTKFLQSCGLVDSKNLVTPLGERIFTRGPGAFGIIYAYNPYFTKHDELIKNSSAEVWVERGENVAASQDANRKTFELANNALDQYCKDSGFTYDNYIEHAVGQGESTRQRFERSKDQYKYFGADLEDAAIAKAREAQGRGELPTSMQFVEKADIGNPKILIDGIKSFGADPSRSVMVVGNGFHEVRSQTNESMTEVFKGYCDAKILLIFTEESGLADSDLLETAWNTYHAGFRYVHELSGQGLRPSLDKAEHVRFSWKKCAELAGYDVLQNYTSRTRTIFPHPKKNGYNPAISVTYFCVPK
jgi:hypothetical protein